jgi:two-component system NtrC family response regulator
MILRGAFRPCGIQQGGDPDTRAATVNEAGSLTKAGGEMAKILVIDDDRDLCRTIKKMLSIEGHQPVSAYTCAEGIQAAGQGYFDLIFLDVMMPDGSGLDMLQELNALDPRPDIIIMTAVGTPDGAEIAIKNGAWDYIQKPFSFNDLRLIVSRVMQYRAEKRKKTDHCILKLDGIVWRGTEMGRCVELLARAAFCEANVLIRGETGTGKDLFARAIHENSRRAAKNFVVVDCASLPANLVESILFGHEKGAFTGADRAEEGLISQADGGTLFLDEVGELPLPVQRSFLRVLQERTFRRVGGSKELTSDFRLIAATNRNLETMAEAGEFRKDLLFRLRSIQIELPPLRGRASDIKEIALHYLSRFSELYGTGVKGFSPEFLEALLAYPWPGNARELVHAIERAYAAAGEEPTFFPVHLPEHIRIRLAKDKLTARPSFHHIEARPPAPFVGRTLKETIEAVERSYLEDLLVRTGGDPSQACKISGLSRTSLYERLRKYGLTNPHGPGRD